MYHHVALGGTFDGLHSGHMHFLREVFAQAKHVTIGLTSEKYIRKYKSSLGVAPYSRRYRALTTWLRKEGVAPRVTIIALHDPFGPTLGAGDFDALAVTRDTQAGASAINRAREERGLVPLPLLTIDLLVAQDNDPISSTRIRRGVIDRKGVLLMPQDMREQLAHPLGKVLSEREIAYSVMHNRDNVIVAVGDVTVEKIFSLGVQPSLAIIDLHVERKPYQSLEAYAFPKKYVIRGVVSGPGFIAREAIALIRLWKKDVKKRMVILVTGEEDLLALPAIVHAPQKSIVYYGSPPTSGRKGLVEVVITPQVQRQAVALLKRFL